MLADKLSVEPTHKGPLLDAAGAGGIGFTITLVETDALLQPFTEAVTLYIPASDVVTMVIIGFCWFDIKLFGPDQL